MTRRIGRRPQALRDIVEAALYISGDNVSAAERFLDAVEATFERLAQSPLIASEYHTSNVRLQGLRVARIRGFPKHLVFYFPQGDGIDVLRVLHGARDLDSILDES
jgi:toxin ParE1/3/4